jgi:hypothetical protein
MFELFGMYKVKRFFGRNNVKHEIIGKLNEVYSEFYNVEQKKQPRVVRIKLGDKEKHFLELFSKLRRQSPTKMNKDAVMKYHSECNYLHEIYQRLNEDAKKKFMDRMLCANASSLVRIFGMIKKSGKSFDDSEITNLITADLNKVEGKEAKEFLKMNIEFIEGKRKGLPKLNI